MYIVMRAIEDVDNKGFYDICDSVDEAIGMVKLKGGRVLEICNGNWYSVKTSAHLVYDKHCGTSWSDG